MNALEFDEFTLAYEEKIIVEGLTAGIPHGDFVGVFGPNGAGKTTFFRAILGLIKPIKGRISVCGKLAQQGNPCIGYLPQLHQEFQRFPLSGRAYLAATLHGEQWGMPFLNQAQREQIESVIHIVGLKDYVDRPVTQFSGGERQRLSLAQALLGEPEILLLDEPLSNLDPGQKEKIIELVHSIQQQLKISVLFTAHNINPLLGVMNRIIYLAHGKAVIGTVDEIINSETLTKLYDTPMEVIRSQGHILVLHKKSGMFLHGCDYHGNHRIDLL